MRNAREVASTLAFYKHIWRRSVGQKLFIYYCPFTGYFGIEERDKYLSPHMPRIQVSYPLPSGTNTRALGAQIARDLKAQAKAA